MIAAVTNPREPLAASSRTTPIVFSEIMCKPAARPDDNNLEFIEIYNSQPWFQDIGGYRIAVRGYELHVSARTILRGGEFRVVAASPGSIRSVYGVTNVAGPYTGSLKKAETLQLWDEQTNLLLTVPYSSDYPWPVAAEGTGHSIVLANRAMAKGTRGRGKSAMSWADRRERWRHSGRARCGRW